MQILILAAGVSQRLMPLTAKKPKTLLKLDNQEILSHILHWFEINGLKKFNFLIGHGQNHVKNFVKTYFENKKDCKYNFIFNPKYKKWGNIYSMFLAKDIFNEDFILINSDVIFHPNILKSLLKNKHDNTLVIDDYKKLGDEEMKVYLDAKKRIVRINKKLDPKKSNGEYIGLLKISAKINKDLLIALYEKLAEDKKVYYEDALQILMDKKIPFYKVSTKGLPCMEIDTAEDLENAKKLIKKCQTNYIARAIKPTLQK